MDAQGEREEEEKKVDMNSFHEESRVSTRHDMLAKCMVDPSQ